MSSYKDVYFVPYENRQKRLSNSKYEKKEGVETESDLAQTQEKMQEKLKNYVEADITLVPLNCHCRYIVFKEGMWRFCLGGVLRQIEKDYVVLSNGRLTWSVQRVKKDKDGNLHTTRFFKYTKPMHSEMNKNLVE